MFNSATDSIARQVRRVLGDSRWCSLMSWLRGSSTRYADGPDGTLVARDALNTMYFFTAKRSGRYRNGIETRLQSTWAKYTTDEMHFGPQDVIIDVGASVGEFALPAARVAGLVFALEPEPRAFAALEVNAKEQNNRIRPSQIAASDVSGEVPFYFAADTADSSAVVPERFTHVKMVPSMRLADFIAEQSICHDRVKLVKIEAEGYEPEVLRGLLPEVRPHWLSVNCDPERKGESPLEEVVDLLEAAGYQVYLRGLNAIAQNLGGQERRPTK